MVLFHSQTRPHNYDKVLYSENPCFSDAGGHLAQPASLPSVHTDENTGSAYSSSQYKTGSSASSGKYQERR